MSIVDIYWAHTAVESEFSQIWSMESGLLMWSVSCGIEFQKLFSSCCSVRVVWSTHASLSGSGSHKLITLYTENSPLAAESWRTLLIISLRLASCAFLSTLFSSCVDSHCSAFLYWAIPFNKSTPYGWQNYFPPLGWKFWLDTPRTDSSLWRITEILLKLFCKRVWRYSSVWTINGLFHLIRIWSQYVYVPG